MRKMTEKAMRDSNGGTTYVVMHSYRGRYQGSLTFSDGVATNWSAYSYANSYFQDWDAKGHTAVIYNVSNGWSVVKANW